MKSVAIMTYHDMVNYGSFLQMYSLQQYLKSMNLDVKIINYRKDSNWLKRIVNNNYYIKKFWLILNNDLLWLKFNEYYKKYIYKTKLVTSEKDLSRLNSKFDYFIAGSDQIWSPNHFDIHYFLDFVTDNNKMISYAPSVVIDSFLPNQVEEVKKQLKRFTAISVREKTSKDVIKKVFSIEPTVVLDPTLIVDIKELNKIIPKINKSKNSKVVSYFIGSNNYSEKLIKLFGASENIVNICLEKANCLPNCSNLLDVSPGEFLSYIKNSDIVCTDSYHGVALAIKYKKQFIVFDRFKQDDPICQNARIYDLLNALGINNINYKDYISGNNKLIDYNLVEEKMDKLIKESTDYLKAILEGNEIEKK